MFDTYSFSQKRVDHKFYLINANNYTVGLVAVVIAKLLMGKDKVNYVPYEYIGDSVILINASDMTLTGKKKKDKFFYRHSGYIGGIKKFNYYDLLKNKPEYIFRKSVRNMLPKNKLGDKMIKHLYIFKGANHNMNAQKPIEYKLDYERK